MQISHLSVSPISFDHQGQLSRKFKSSNLLNIEFHFQSTLEKKSKPYETDVEVANNDNREIIHLDFTRMLQRNLCTMKMHYILKIQMLSKIRHQSQPTFHHLEPPVAKCLLHKAHKHSNLKNSFSKHMQDDQIFPLDYTTKTDRNHIIIVIIEPVYSLFVDRFYVSNMCSARISPCRRIVLGSLYYQ